MFSRISHIAKFTGFIGMVALSLLSVSSCDNIYDDLSEIPSNNDKENCYTNVDATSYTTWVYLNFADGSQTSLPYDNTADIPADWTIALHRYDIKTNSGSAFRTGYTSLDEVKTAAKTGTFPMPDASEFTRDEPSKITIDMSQYKQCNRQVAQRRHIVDATGLCDGQQCVSCSHKKRQRVCHPVHGLLQPIPK